MFILISLIQPCVSPEAEIKVLLGIKVLTLYVIKSAKLNGTIYLLNIICNMYFTMFRNSVQNSDTMNRALLAKKKMLFKQLNFSKIDLIKRALGVCLIK